MMKRSCLFAAVLAIAGACWSAPAGASPGSGRDRTIGVGVEFHGPGLSLKFAPAPDHAFQFGVAASNYGRYRKHHDKYFHDLYGYDAGSFKLHAEYLATQGNLVRGRGFDLPWYVGGGVTLGIGDQAAALAVQGHLGVALQFARAPFDLFLEWTPRVWLVDFIAVRPADANAGVRFWF